MQTLRRYHAALGSSRWPAAMVRASVLALGWVGLTRADPTGLAFGAVVVALALFVSVRISPLRATTWRPLGVLQLTGAFVTGSLLGGVQVARQALAMHPTFTPTLVSFRSRLPTERALDLMMSTLSLMPGSLGVERHGRELLVHVLLGSRASSKRRLEVLETLIANALGVPLLEQEPTND